MIEVYAEVDHEDLAQQLADTMTREDLMNFLLLVDANVADYGFTAELQAKLQAALRREDAA